MAMGLQHFSPDARTREGRTSGPMEANTHMRPGTGHVEFGAFEALATALLLMLLLASLLG